MKKKIFRTLLVVLVAAGVIYALVGVDKKPEDLACIEVSVDIDSHSSQFPLSKNDVLKILEQQHLTLVGTKMGEIDAKEVERVLIANERIDTAVCQAATNGKVQIRVTPEWPVLRVLTDNADYYLAHSGHHLKADDICEPFIVVTGNVGRVDVHQLAQLGDYLGHHPYWSTRIQQINIVGANDVELITNVSDHIVKMGNLDNYQQKLSNLQVFYREGLPKIGWNKYHTINIAYENIVVGGK